MPNDTQWIDGEGAPAAAFPSEADRIREAYARRTNRSAYSMFEPAFVLMVQERERELLRLLSGRGLNDLSETRILEIGCGSGLWLQQFVRWGARPENLTGLDLLPERIEDARRLCPSGVTFHCQSAASLANIGRPFDLVLQSTVFTSILDPGMKQQIAKEMLSVLGPQGMIVWYDFHVNNPSNRDVRGIPAREIHQLFPGCRIELRRLTLAPPLGRSIARLSRTLYGMLSAVKPLCSHYLGIITK